MCTTTEHPLRIARRRAGLTLKQLGEAAGVDHTTISKMELRQLPNGSLATYRAIGRALGIDWRTLVED